jgi:hypothetical protein
LVAELETAGFSATRRQVNAPDQETLLRSLVNSEPAFASIVMLREGAGGAAFVWLSGAARVKRFAMSDVSSSRAAGAIALRVAEYLNMQVLTIAVPPPAPTPEDPAPPEVESEPTPSEGSGRPPAVARKPESAYNSLVWLGPGALLSSDSHNVAASAHIGVGTSLTRLFTLEGNADFSAVPLAVETDYGTTKVTATSARLYGVVETQLSEHFSLGLGLGAGILRLSSDSEGAPGIVGQSDSTSTTLLAARARLLLRTRSGFSLLAAVDPAVVVPAAKLQADEQDVARLGRPWLSGTLGAGWSF